MKKLEGVITESQYNEKKSLIENKLDEVETLDMPVDITGDKSNKLYSEFLNDLKIKFKDFLSKLKQEGTETKEAFNLVVKASKGEIKLSKEQRKQIFDQLKDLLKIVGLIALDILPGDIVILLLIKFLKLEKFVLPSAFLKKH